MYLFFSLTQHRVRTTDGTIQYTLFWDVGVDPIAKLDTIMLIDSCKHLGGPMAGRIDRTGLDIHWEHNRTKAFLLDIFEQTALVPQSAECNWPHAGRVVVAQIFASHKQQPNVVGQ